MKLPASLFWLAATLTATSALAQHEQHAMPGMAMPPAKPTADTTQRRAMKPDAMPPDSSHLHGMHMSGMAGMDMGGMSMSHAYSRNLPMSLNGSGTAWNPDQTPMYM
jgi:hypothetical protein